MESCGYTEAEAISAAQRQQLESESRQMIAAYGEYLLRGAAWRRVDGR